MNEMKVTIITCKIRYVCKQNSMWQDENKNINYPSIKERRKFLREERKFAQSFTKEKYFHFNKSIIKHTS